MVPVFNGTDLFFNCMPAIRKSDPAMKDNDLTFFLSLTTA